MGAGKSTLGPILATRLGWRFLDVDDTLVRTHGASIADLFERFGEARFRGLEEDAIAGLLAEERLVLALGGGALESHTTRERLLRAPGTHLVFLETPLEIALARCAQQSGGAVRPVLEHLDRAGLKDRYARRLEHYRLAHQTILTADRTPDQVAGTLLDALALD